MISSLQDVQLWVGFGFVLLLIVFLMTAFFTKETLSDGQRQILKFLCSLCAGFAGALITGTALFSLNSQFGGGTTLAISGSAGCALFFAVWFTFDNVARPPDAFHFRIPQNWNFQQVADAIARQDGSVAEFNGFQPTELAAPIDSREMHARTVHAALLSLRSLAGGAQVREYRVEHSAPTYKLTVVAGSQPPTGALQS